MSVLAVAAKSERKTGTRGESPILCMKGALHQHAAKGAHHRWVGIQLALLSRASSVERLAF